MPKSPLQKKQDKEFWNRTKKEIMAKVRFGRRGARGGKGRKR